MFVEKGDGPDPALAGDEGIPRRVVANRRKLQVDQTGDDLEVVADPVMDLLHGGGVGFEGGFGFVLLATLDLGRRQGAVPGADKEYHPTVRSPAGPALQ